MFLRREAAGSVWPLIAGDGVRLRCPKAGDYAQWAELRGRSRAFLEPWEPAWAADELSRAAFQRRLKRYDEEFRAGRVQPFFIFSADGGQLMGGLTLSQIHRGVVQSAGLGYWMGEDFAGRGHMKAAVMAVIRHAFDTLALHRLNAACQPHNMRSRGLLARAGFVEEGFARAYLRIDGQWRDHVLYGLVNPHN